MDLKAYEQLVSSESSARRYVTHKCFPLRHRICPRCHARKLYHLADHRRRCSRCRYTFREFTGRWLDRCRLSCAQWLRVVKLFELEVSTRKMADQLAVSYKAAYKAATTLRLALLAQSEDGKNLLGKEVELDESYFGGHRKGKRGRGAADKIPVFGILERAGRVQVQVVPDVSAETLLSWTLKTVRRGSIVYTDRFKSYDSLMFCGYRHLKVDHTTRFASGRVYINGLEGFWSFAKERLLKHHGISPQRFPLYLKELEFRYNHREEDLF
ncbi:MAG: IS1595 family transposase, partial [Acidobacteriota bacterium]